MGDTDGDGYDGDDLAENDDGKGGGGGGGGGGTFDVNVDVDGFNAEKNWLSRKSFIVLVLLLGSESDDNDLYICTFLLLKCISEAGYLDELANFAMAKKSVSILDASSPIPVLVLDDIADSVLVTAADEPPPPTDGAVVVAIKVANDGADDELCRASFLPPSSTVTVAFERADNLGI